VPCELERRGHAVVIGHVGSGVCFIQLYDAPKEQTTGDGGRSYVYVCVLGD